MKKIIPISVLAVIMLLFSAVSVSQSVGPENVIIPIGFDVSPKLSDIPPIPPGYVDMTWKEKVIPNKDGFLEEFMTEAAWNGPDPVLQQAYEGTLSAPTVHQNFSGQSNTTGVAPPDTDGDVGPYHYMQMVNLSLQIWDKNGNSLYGPALSSTLWDGFSGPWSTTNDGDPIVLYDEYSDRWIATQFALPNYPFGPFYELVAVSATGDPTGTWYRYAYEFSNMPDYPKFGIWPDGYYMTINQFKPPSLSFAGAAVSIFDRDAMISGNPTAQMLFFNLGTSYGSLLPADVDGPTPPAGSPNYLANLGTNALRIWEADVDWGNVPNSSVTLVKTLATQSFSYSGIVINQPGTSQTLDPLASRLMYRLQYRNFGTYEAMVTNHTVNANGSGQAGVRWYELRNYGSGWSIYQQGTFAPPDGIDRWMGSVAMNGNGDIGVGYTVSSSSTYPSIRFTGQTAANSGTGILDVEETSIHAGAASQTGVNRWGDYSMMSIDPTDDMTFWYTSEYSSGGWDWETKIASFSFEPPVLIAPVANFSGNPTTVMATQQVQFTDLSSNNPTSWTWTFQGGTPGSSEEKNPTVIYNTPGLYTVSLTASNSAGSDSEEKAAYISVTEYLATYCASAGNSTLKEWINSLGLGTYSNNSGSDNGYGDYTAPSILLESGTDVSLSLSPGFSGKSRTEYWRVWIDYNMDGDFSDTGEEVFAANAQKGSVSGTVSIPAGLTGETRMRVSMKYNAIPAPCELFAYGEVEDYTLSLSAPVPQPPLADFYAVPATVAAGNAVQFTDASLNNPTSWSWTFPGGTPATSTDQNPPVVYNTVGAYDVTLTATNDQGSDTKTIYSYITVVESGSYCESQSTSNFLDWISEVSIGSFSNPSGASLYSDFTGQTVGMAPGMSHAMALSPNSTNQRNFWRIWIDFNSDGDFEDPGEQVFAVNNKKGPVSGTVVIPAGSAGQTRMRVTMKTGGAPTSCETFPDGEVEDYTADFGSGPTLLTQNTGLEADIFPNPASDKLNVLISSPSEKVNIKLYNALGQIIRDFDTSDKNISLSLDDLKAGIYYVGADDGVQTLLKRFIKD